MPETNANDTGPLPAPLRGTVGRVAEAAYRFGLGRRSTKFDRGQGVRSLERPVISIGNLSVGGTGKTPMVALVCRWLSEAHRHPVIAMRGYKSSDERGSDEADSYRRMLPGVPVVANPARHAALESFFESPDGDASDTVILDDGFQHRQLERDLDIVLIDAGRNPFTDRLLPLGWLREPVEALERADAVVLTHAESAATAEVEEIARKLNAIAVTEHAWSGLDVLDPGEDHRRPTDWLADRRVFAACAIGRPDAFFEEAERVCGEGLVGMMRRPDHDRFGPKTVRELRDRLRETGADTLLVTDKDWSKLRHEPADVWGMPVARPRLEIRFRSGEDELRRLVQRVASMPDAGAEAGS